MLTKEEAHGFAANWLAAWNAHDLDQIMAHYITFLVLRGDSSTVEWSGATRRR